MDNQAPLFRRARRKLASFTITRKPPAVGLASNFNYDFAWGSRISGLKDFVDRCRIDLAECAEAPQQLNSARKILESKIRYWTCRPMNGDARAIVSPADARLVIGSLNDTSNLLLKGKFFDLHELLRPDKARWFRAFVGGDYVICRLTPEKYHYNHSPVAGPVLDIYENDGSYHSCHPEAVIALATPFSKNKRVVTVIDTEAEGGTPDRVGCDDRSCGADDR